MLSGTTKTCPAYQTGTTRGRVVSRRGKTNSYRGGRKNYQNTLTRIFEMKGQLPLDTNILNWGEPNCHKKLVIAVPSHWAVLRLSVAEIRITAMHDACQSDG